MKASRDLADLLTLMAALRHPKTGCAWDLKQDFQSIVPYTLEEAYEVADAVERGDLDDLKDELGDLLLQVVFFAQMASEKDSFDFHDVVETISAKLIRRHPHIFGDGRAYTPEDVKALWDKVKAQEQKLKLKKSLGLLGDVSSAMPALPRAVKLQDKAGSVGFDWNDAHAVLAKIREEIDEFEEALDENTQREQEEFGDLLFALANLARHRKIDPETALRLANQKFCRRFASIEQDLMAKGLTPKDASLEEMEALWDKAKRAERKIA